MGFCKEIEICKPNECRKANCFIGKELRKLSKIPQCGEICLWIKQGVNGINLCKDSSCSIGNVIVEFRNKIDCKGGDLYERQ